MRRVLAQTRKDLTQIARDRLALTLALVLPLALLLLLGSALSLKVSGIAIVVQDLDDTPESRSLIDSFRQSLTFHIERLNVTDSPQAALDGNRARAALIIPVHFSRDLTRGSAASVQLLIDSSDANTAKLIAGYASRIALDHSKRQAGGASTAPIVAQVRYWYNPGGESKKFYGPGIFVLGISMFPPLLAALAMAKEGEQKTILQVYVSNIPAHEFLLGKILAFMAIALAESLLGFTLLFTYFGMHIAGDPTPLIVSTILYAFCVSAFGSLIGAAIPDQASAIQAVSVGGFLLVFLLSGLIFPVENIPAGLRWISSLIWGRYYIEIVRDGLLEGGGWPAMWPKVLAVATIGAVFYLMGWRSLRRMQLSY